MNEKGKRLQRQKQEDATFNRMLICLGVIVGLEVLALLLKRLYINFDYTSVGVAVAQGLNTFFGVFRFLGVVLAAAGCVWVVRASRQKKKLTCPLICTCAALWLWVASVLCYGLNVMGVSLLCALPAVLAVLCAIYFLYQREFFVNGVLGAIGIAVLWVARQIYMSHPRMTYCGAAAVCVIMAVTAFAAFRLSKQGGKVGKVQIISAGASYLPVYLTCAVVALTVVVAVLLNAAVVGYYAIAVLAAWIFCLAVYYTVKLM